MPLLICFAALSRSMPDCILPFFGTGRGLGPRREFSLSFHFRDRSWPASSEFGRSCSGGSEAWTWFVCVVMLHGIYSLSFLELWALADDSYSLAIMEIIDRGGTAGDPALMQRLEAIGMCKQTSRLDALQAIGLFARSETARSRSRSPAGRGLVRARPAFPRQCSQIWMIHVADLERGRLFDERARPCRRHALCQACGNGGDFRGDRRDCRGPLIGYCHRVTA